jgi:competence protein CoiA
MKFAFVEGKRQEAQPGLPGECPVCDAAMIAKCGNVRAPHWAHRRPSDCDPWWEPETPWHRDWKNHFPINWQETIHTSANGEKHIADVKTDSGVVLEFQHSPLDPAERQSRENFYPKMVWIVDGARRKRDPKQFFESLRGPMFGQSPIYSVSISDSALLRDWGVSRVPVYFDFGTGETGDASGFDTTALWRLNPRTRDGSVYLLRVPRAEFLRVHLEGEPFDEQCAGLVEQVEDYFRRQARSQPLTDFARYQARRQRARLRLARHGDMRRQLWP